MGADLYIRKVYEANRAKWEPAFLAAAHARDTAYPTIQRNNPEYDALQAKVSETYDNMMSEGYFRDSYNSSSVMWQMGLSWWNDVTPLCNKKGELGMKAIKKLIAMIESRPITIQGIQESWDKANKEAIENKYKLTESAQDWFEYFTKDRTDLLAFLRKALELKEPIDASL